MGVAAGRAVAVAVRASVAVGGATVEVAGEGAVALGMTGAAACCGAVTRAQLHSGTLSIKIKTDIRLRSFKSIRITETAPEATRFGSPPVLFGFENFVALPTLPGNMSFRMK